MCRIELVYFRVKGCVICISLSILRFPSETEYYHDESNQHEFMKFEILTAVKLQIAVFWIIMSYRLVEGYQRFAGTLKRERALSSEKFVTIYPTIWCHNPKKLNLHVSETGFIPAMLQYSVISE
jgi:hypothetical protein